MSVRLLGRRVAFFMSADLHSLEERVMKEVVIQPQRVTRTQLRDGQPRTLVRRARLRGGQRGGVGPRLRLSEEVAFS